MATPSAASATKRKPKPAPIPAPAAPDEFAPPAPVIVETGPAQPPPPAVIEDYAPASPTKKRSRDPREHENDSTVPTKYPRYNVWKCSGYDCVIVAETRERATQYMEESIDNLYLDKKPFIITPLPTTSEGVHFLG